MKVGLVLIMWALAGGCGLQRDEALCYAPEELRQQLAMGLSQLDKKELLGKEVKNAIQCGGEQLEDTSNCPAIMQLHAILNPNPAHAPWLREGHGEIPGLLPALPAHVVIRFGTHRSYGYALLFEEPHDFPPSLQIDHVGGCVYFSRTNQ